jgi:hypothetical protein
VLPTDNIADNFVNTRPGQWDESSKVKEHLSFIYRQIFSLSFSYQWFYNNLEVQNTGNVLREFMEFHDANSELKDSCYLISLENEDPTKSAAQISVLENRAIKTENFHPPKKILLENIMYEVKGWKVNK